jgi:methylenetetrahydrofolate reductase (NADPH)
MDTGMIRSLPLEISNPDHFTVTLELVPGREAFGRAVDTVMSIARDAFSDGRVSAVSITDNPGGNPSLSPDVLGYNIFEIGMDVIVHFTCRDANRVGMESRALQLTMMGMKNILALNGDYSGKGFGGQGAPVFDLDSVQLQMLLGLLSERINAAGDPDGFFTGCAVSPFKSKEGECFAQYAKLWRKAAAGAQFVITQLGYDARKFQELIQVEKAMGLNLPTLGSVYVLTPKVAHIINAGNVPGAVVTDPLLKQIEKEWRDKAQGRQASIERAARLAAVLKGLGYAGIHIGGIHRRFDTAGRILDRFAEIEGQWRDFLPEFDFPQPGGFYAFDSKSGDSGGISRFGKKPPDIDMLERFRYWLLRRTHDMFFNSEHPLAPTYRKIFKPVDRTAAGELVMGLLEDLPKRAMLHCRRCGDCAIQHVGFLCPESQCAKHCRNGACGGSRDGHCEVYPDRPCVWDRAYNRLARANASQDLMEGCVPPRMWELNETSSWLNFYMQRDHQGPDNELAQRCRVAGCRLLERFAPDLILGR